MEIKIERGRLGWGLPLGKPPFGAFLFFFSFFFFLGEISILSPILKGNPYFALYIYQFLHVASSLFIMYLNIINLEADDAVNGRNI